MPKRYIIALGSIKTFTPLSSTISSLGLMSFAYWAVLAPIVGLSSLIIGINLTADAFAKALGNDRSTKAPV